VFLFAISTLFLLMERSLRPLLEELSQAVPAEIELEGAGIPLRARLLATLPAMNVVAGVAVPGVAGFGNGTVARLGLVVLISFGIALYLLQRLAFPRITAALDKRQRAIEDAIDTAERTRTEADEILAEYRERLKEARAQADEIVVRARKAAEVHEREATEEARAKREEKSVTFEPGARTAWHTHPLGQTLIVTAGCGWVQRWNGPIEEIRPGDVVWFSAGEKHWHGATPTTGMIRPA